MNKLNIAMEKRQIERLMLGHGYSLSLAKAAVIRGWHYRWLARFSFTFPIFLFLVRGVQRDVRPPQIEKQKQPASETLRGRPTRASGTFGQ